MTAKEATDTLIEELMKKLPPVGSVWPVEKRALWLRAADSILSLVYDIDSVLSPIRIVISEQEKENLKSPIAPRVRTDRPNGARSAGTPRPQGIPSTFSMVQEVLSSDDSTDGLTLLEFAAVVAMKWWPGMHKNAISPDISTWITKGRLVRDADGRLTLTDVGRALKSTDNRLKSAAPSEDEEPPPEEPESLAGEPAEPEAPELPEERERVPAPPAAAPAMSEEEIRSRAAALAQARQREQSEAPTEVRQVRHRATRIPGATRQVVTPGAKLGAPTQTTGRPFLYNGKSVDLGQAEWRVAECLKKAMGKGHLDYNFLGMHGRGAVSRAAVSDRSWCVEVIPIMSRKLKAIGLEAVHSPNFGYVMREIEG